MGFSREYKYILAIRDCRCVTTIEGWMVRDRGRPTKNNILRYLNKLTPSFEPGGINEHVSKELGYIPYPKEAWVMNQRTQEVKARVYWE